MKNVWLSLLSICVIACGAVGMSRAQTPPDEVIAGHANPEPTPPQVHRDISKILSARESPAAAPSASNAPRNWITLKTLDTIHAGGRNFSPPSYECAEAIEHALNAQTLLPAPDEKCADMMDEALEVRLRTGE